jgi:hypothetical protein
LPQTISSGGTAYITRREIRFIARTSGYIPAGYGDMAIGYTATFVVWKLADPGHRNSFIIWQVLGIVDLIMVVSVGTTAVLLDPHGASMVAMTVFPLSVVPSFVVPPLVIRRVLWYTTRRLGTA